MFGERLIVVDVLTALGPAASGTGGGGKETVRKYSLNIT